MRRRIIYYCFKSHTRRTRTTPAPHATACSLPPACARLHRPVPNSPLLSLPPSCVVWCTPQRAAEVSGARCPPRPLTTGAGPATTHTTTESPPILQTDHIWSHCNQGGEGGGGDGGAPHDQLLRYSPTGRKCTPHLPPQPVWHFPHNFKSIAVSLQTMRYAARHLPSPALVCPALPCPGLPSHPLRCSCPAQLWCIRSAMPSPALVCHSLAWSGLLWSGLPGAGPYLIVLTERERSSLS